MHATKSTNSKPLILIVDDDRLMRLTVQHALEKEGFRTANAHDGPSALEVFTKLQPDLVLLDVVMPDMDGFAVCREIRKSPEHSLTPILMVTSSDDLESIHGAFDAGATDFIAKPVNTELLKYRIRYMLRSSRSMRELAMSEARLAHAQRIARMGNWEWNPAGGTFWGSEETFHILGMKTIPLDFSFENFLFLAYPADRSMVESGLKNACVNNTTCSLEYRLKHADGTLHTVRLQGQALEKFPGILPVLVGTIQDITEMKQSEEHLQMLKEAVDSLPIGITITDLHGKITYLNPAEAQMHGYTIDELLKRDACNFAPARLRKPVSMERPEKFGLWRRESVNIRRNGQEFPVELSSIAVKNHDGRYLGVVTACEDITHRKEVQEKIHRLAYHDTLTGLPNRRTFLDRLNQALALAQRENRQAGLLFLDLDNFKDVNDTKGHDFGDKLLQEVARRLDMGIRTTDTLARLGGDEFIIVLASDIEQEGAATAAQRIHELFTRPFVVEGQKIFASVSIGISLYPNDGLTTESLFKSADTAMYHAKNEGRSCYRFFSDAMNQEVMQRVAKENSLHQGLERQEFFLHYQPQWDVKTGRITGAEALLRWRSQDLGLVPPAEFIFLAEKTGLIFALGEWVLRTACTQMREWASSGHQGLKVAVNISGKQLRQPDFLEVVGRTIRETGVDPAALALEFTESVVMDEADKTIKTLQELKRMGVQLSIDDFGTGYSSLSYLKHFPIDQIKIDRSFIADVTNNKDDATIVEAIISLAHSLNMKVIAEGVETSDQMHFLSVRACDEVQGFYLGMPMSTEELTLSLADVLKEWGYGPSTHVSLRNLPDLASITPVIAEGSDKSDSSIRPGKRR